MAVSVRQWRPSAAVHSQLPARTRTAIVSCLALAAGDLEGYARHPEGQLYRLPQEVLFHTFVYMALPGRDYAQPRVPRILLLGPYGDGPRRVAITPEGNILMAGDDAKARICSPEGVVLREVPLDRRGGSELDGTFVLVGVGTTGQYWPAAMTAPGGGVKDTALPQLPRRVPLKEDLEIETPSGRRRYMFPGGLRHANGLVFGRDMKLYVADCHNACVHVLSESRTKTWQNFGVTPPRVRPTGIAIDAADHIVLVDGPSNRVLVLTTSGTVLSVVGVWGQGPGTFDWPLGCAVLEDGGIVVCDYYNSRLQII